MDGDRTLSLLVDPDQWARCAHTGTVLIPGGGVELSWADDTAPGPAHPPPGGLAFDHECRAYRTDPDAGAVHISSYDGQTTSISRGLRRPLGLAVDRGQLLYIAESSAGVVQIVDLSGQRLLRRTSVRPGRPVDVAPDGDGVLVLLRHPDRLARLHGRRNPRPGPPLRRPCWSPRLDPVRIAGGPLVLWAAARGADALVARPDATMLLPVPGATDIATAPDGTLVVARGAGRSLLRYAPDGKAWTELEPLQAPDFDGMSVAVAADGRVAFTTGAGVGWTAGSAARHVRDGAVVTYRLDSGAHRTRWGRVFLDACLPAHTSAGLRFVTSDDADVADPIPASPPERGARTVPDPAATPPLVSRSAMDAAGQAMPVFRRPNGPEQPWEQLPTDDAFETYEAPVKAGAGRFLWIELVLHGTAAVTPRVRALRVERPGHQLLRALPKAWSRDDDTAQFLQRFLASSEGLLHELDLRAATRAVLVDPATTPAEALDWLASFAGLVLDGRWPEQNRRDLIAQAYPLLRRRGTKAALTQIINLYLGYPPVIVESWQLRGLGGTVLGLTPAGEPAPAVGGSARATGSLGRFMVGGLAPGQTSFTGAAHRFCVLVPGNLTGEQRDVIRGILDQHRPAHTVCELLELGPGMRVGDRLRVRLTSFIGPGSRPDPAVVGRSLVGAGAVVGHAVVGSCLGAANVGEVRVG